MMLLAVGPDNYHLGTIRKRIDKVNPPHEANDTEAPLAGIVAELVYHDEDW
jgi:hypothetical protein